jgi:hypothetical protein
MSYILDALKRAEQQRGGAARTIMRAPRELSFDGASRGPWPWVAAGGIGVGAVVAAVALWPATTPPPFPSPAPAARPPGGSRPAAPATLVQPSPARPAPVAAPTPSSEKPAPSVSKGVESRAPSSVDRPSAKRAPSPAPAERSATIIARPQPIDRDADSATAEALALPPGSRDDDTAIPPALVPTVRSAEVRPRTRVDDGTRGVRPAARSDARAASVSTPDAGGEVKTLAAKISLQVVSWAPEPKDRFVFLNGQRYGEGQVIDNKLLVERITEDGVVLSYRGERVTLKGR